MDRTDNTELPKPTQPEDLEESRHQTEEAAASTLEPATEAEAPEEFLAEAQAEAPEEAPTEAQEEVPAEARVEALEAARGEVLAETLEEAPAEGLAEAPEEAVPEMSDMETMSELYEESLRRVQEGEVVKGRIVSITKDFVMVDIGYKSEGQIPIHEFPTPEGEITAQVGEEVEALMESREDEEGALLLSKNKASKIKVWEGVSYAYHHDGDVLGTEVAKDKGGLLGDHGGF